MINTYIPYFKKKDQNILSQCLKTNFVSTAGPLVKKFEDNFSKEYNFKYSVALNSGTSALHLGLKAIGVKNGDTVILPSYTFAATANAVIYNNAHPWFFDCNENFEFSLNQIEKTLKKETYFKNKNLILKKTGSIVRAIIPVSTFGKKINFNSIKTFSNKYNLKIIFDTAACHDPKIFKFKKNNKMNFCFSFNGNKTLTTGAGGMFSSNSKSLVSKIRTLANVGKKLKKYDYETVGYNYKMTNIQASLGLLQLKNLDNIIYLKKKIFSKYKQIFSSIRGISLISDDQYTNWIFGIIVQNFKKFKIIKNALNKSNIQMDLFWKPLHLQQPYKNFKKSNLNFSNSIWNRVIILPSHPGLKNKQQTKVIKNLLKNLK
jgi:perosamine synthetase